MFMQGLHFSAYPGEAPIVSVRPLRGMRRGRPDRASMAGCRAARVCTLRAARHVMGCRTRLCRVGCHLVWCTVPCGIWDPWAAGRSADSLTRLARGVCAGACLFVCLRCPMCAGGMRVVALQGGKLLQVDWKPYKVSTRQHCAVPPIGWTALRRDRRCLPSIAPVTQSPSLRSQTPPGSWKTGRTPCAPRPPQPMTRPSNPARGRYSGALPKLPETAAIRDLSRSGASRMATSA